MFENLLEQNISLQALLVNPWVLTVIGLVIWHIGGNLLRKVVVKRIGHDEDIDLLGFLSKWFFPISLIVVIITLSVFFIYKSNKNAVAKILEDK